MKTVLITGGSRGIGAATVQKFAHEHYTVILNFNKSQIHAERICENLREEGYDVHMIRADLSDENQIISMFEYVLRVFKHLDVLVNNAGVALYRQCQDVSSKDYDAVMGVNAKGTFLCCRESLKLFVPQKYGSIVNVSSVWGVKGASCESVYSMSKHAVVGLTKSLALELAPCGISVNCICPPIVTTDMCAQMSKEDISEFCFENNVSVYTPQQVAEDIYRLATCGGNGNIFIEK